MRNDHRFWPGQHGKGLSSVSLSSGVALVLAEWDRATRSLMDGIRIMERVHHRDAFIKVLDRPGLDLTTPSG